MKTRNFCICTKVNKRQLISIILTVSVIMFLPLHSASAQLSQNIVNQLTNDINDAKNTANNAAQSYAKVAQSFQDVKNTTDSLYILSMAGIGIGAAGVVIAVIALTRKN